MKKRIFIICILALAVVLFCVFILSRPNSLGNINRIFNDNETGSSDISFSGEAGDRIKFSFKSDIKNGDLDIVLRDSNGSVVYELDKARELETFYVLQKSDTYVLSSEYNDFVGKYSITVYGID